MIQIKKKHLILLVFLNLLAIVVISFGMNYAFSKLFWSNRVSVHAGINSTEFSGAEKPDSLMEAYIGQAYKIGTAFEVYKPKDPLLKVVSQNHGALELAVSSGREHFSDLSEARDAIIRKVGEGNLILSIPSYTDKNIRSILIANESKAFMEFKNSDHLLINTRNMELSEQGVLHISDLKLDQLADSICLVEYLQMMRNKVDNQNHRLQALEDKIK